MDLIRSALFHKLILLAKNVEYCKDQQLIVEDIAFHNFSQMIVVKQKQEENLNNPIYHSCQTYSWNKGRLKLFYSAFQNAGLAEAVMPSISQLFMSQAL